MEGIIKRFISVLGVLTIFGTAFGQVGKIVPKQTSKQVPETVPKQVSKQVPEIILVQKIYTCGQTLASQGISLKNWGAGNISETEELPAPKSPCLRISTRNFFSGGILVFNEPLDIFKAAIPEDNLLTFTFKRADLSLLLGGTQKQKQPTSPKNSKDSSPNKLTTFRCVITMSDGYTAEAYIPIDTNDANENGWYRVGIPITSFKNFVRSNYKLKEILITGDAIGTFYLSNVDILKDPTPITGKILGGDLNLALGQEVTLSAEGSDGATVLRYEWSFNPKKWNSVDAVGRTVKRKFSVPGTYFVTLTISDIYGLKSPFITSINVTVNP